MLPLSHTTKWSSLRMLYWLPVQQRIKYEVALLTFKVHSMLIPSYLHHVIQDLQHGCNLRSTTVALCQPFTMTNSNAQLLLSGTAEN